MNPELALATFVSQTRLEEVPLPVQRVVRHILMTVLGTSLAGAEEDGVREVMEVYGTPAQAGAARVLVHGTRLSAASAATVNGVMARSLDFCDAMAPGLHIGSSLVPAALAAAEARGGCSGQEFLAALTVGAELASRMNLTEQAYAGLDPTGIAGVFGSTAAASRILRLDASQTRHALALAFNRCGGSFQSNIDGSLAVRMIQGWVAGDGVNCARLAQVGMTGPAHFLSGVYGYARLYAKSPDFESAVAQDLGTRYRVLDTMFKKYPSCGMTQGATELALRMLDKHALDAGSVEHIEARVPAYGFRLVGHEFQLGENPRVNAQFSLQYCVANALLRRSSTLDHFRPKRIQEGDVLALARRVKAVHDVALDARDHTSVALQITMTDGTRFTDALDIAPGFPGQPLTDQEHAERFAACLRYAGRTESTRQALLQWLGHLPECDDVRGLVDLTLQQ